MKYCRFEHNGGEQYGLVESVAGREEITRLLVTAPEAIGGDIEDLRTKRATFGWRPVRFLNSGTKCRPSL